MNTTSAATVTSRGQVTLPRAVREILGNSKTVEFEVVGNVITLHAVPDMSGCFADYVNMADLPFSEIRKQVWSEVARDKVC